MQNKINKFYRQVSEDETAVLDVYFKVTQIAENEVNIIEVGENGIIIYDTRISKKVVEENFNFMKMTFITEEDFNNKIIEKLKKKDEK